MTVIARRVASNPVRTPTGTWTFICELLTHADSGARAKFEALTGVIGLLISEEYTADYPIIVSGAGPQLRIYTRHGEDAIEVDPEDESPIQSKLRDEGWIVSLPARGADVAMVRSALALQNEYFLVRDVDQESAAATTAESKEKLVPSIHLDEMARE